MPRINLVYGDSRRPVSLPPQPAVSEVPTKEGGGGHSPGKRVFNGRLARVVKDIGRSKIQEEKARGQEPESLVELDRLVGLNQVKDLVRELHAYVEVGQWRAREKLNTEPISLHMVFRGNPGTGKTTVARILGNLLREMGVLSKGHLLEVERADLVGEYIGHTAQRTREQIRKAMGGVLFIDEAYSLARGGDKDFGREAIDTLVRAMEQHRNDFVLILAGYRQEMEWFLRTNPGLRSRLPLQLDFPDYTTEELMDIARFFLAERDYYMSAEAEAYLERFLRQRVAEGSTSQGNARLVRNLLERATRRQARRLLAQGGATREELMRLEVCEFQGEVEKAEKERARSDLALDFSFQA